MHAVEHLDLHENRRFRLVTFATWHAQSRNEDKSPIVASSNPLHTKVDWLRDVYTRFCMRAIWSNTPLRDVQPIIYFCLYSYASLETVQFAKYKTDKVHMIISYYVSAAFIIGQILLLALASLV
jgi:hypothetical protein